ncbi:hypothetical protein Gotur_021420 [Gossypium turneri]
MGSKALCNTCFISSTACFSKHRSRKPISTATPKIFAARRSDNDDLSCSGVGGGGRRRLVDENMIVLRKRIHEIKMIERNYEPPADWMEWEKRYYTSYDSIICDVLGVLQSQLMNTRPSLALGMVAVMMLSLPASAAFVVVHAVEMIKRIMETGMHI